MYKKISRCITPLLILAIAFMPVRAYAFVPAAVYAAAATSTGSSFSMSAGTAALLGMVGASMSFASFEDSSGKKLRFPLSSGTPVPAPSAPATTTPSGGGATETYRVYRSITTYDEAVQWGGLYTGNTSAACSAACTKEAGTFGGSNQCLIAGTWKNCGSSTWTAPAQCPSGYMVSGSSCVLDNARLVTSDNAVDYQRSGTTLTPIADIDTTPTGVNYRVDPDGTIIVLGYSDNNPAKTTRYQITPTVDGGAQVRVDVQGQISGTPVVETTTVNVGNDGKVQTVSGQTNQGAVPTDFTPAQTTTPVDPVKVELPTDYARTGEADAAAIKITTALAQAPADAELLTQRNDLTTNTQNHKTLLDDLGSKGQSDLGGLLSWTLPAPVVQDNTCTDPVIDVMRGTTAQRTMTIDGYCSTIFKIREILEWVLYVITLYFLFDIVTGRREER